MTSPTKPDRTADRDHRAGAPVGASIRGRSRTPSKGTEHRAVATFVPEPTNRFDPHAVAVHIDEQRIGCLPREDARRYRPALDQIYASGRRPTVTARIWAGDYEDRDPNQDATVTRYGAGVHVALDEPHLLLPTNSTPQEPHVLLPDGSTIQVHDTTSRLDQLATIPGTDGEQWVYATLHHVIEQLARATRDIVEVRVNGERVGKLTPKMSGDVLPAVRFLAAHGRVTAARLLVSGNRAAVTRKLYVAHAHQLDDHWFEGV
jgi:collagen type III alpha